MDIEKKIKARLGHMSWGAGDVQFHKDKKKPEKDRSSHMAWNNGDVEFHTPVPSATSLIKRRIKEDMGFLAPHDDPYHFHPLAGGHNYYDAPPELNPVKEHNFSDEELENQWSHRRSMDSDMKRQIRDYKDDSTGNFNGHIRNMRFSHRPNGTIIIPEGFGERFHHMDKVTSNPTKGDMRLFRGFGEGFDVSKLHPGAEFTDHGYSGLSLNPMISRNFGKEVRGHDGRVQYGSEHGMDASHVPVKTFGVIHVPKGTLGHHLDLNDDFDHSHEKEFVLGRGTRFKVSHHSRDIIPFKDYAGETTNFPAHLVHLKVLGQHPKPLIEDKDTYWNAY